MWCIYQNLCGVWPKKKRKVCGVDQKKRKVCGIDVGAGWGKDGVSCGKCVGKGLTKFWQKKNKGVNQVIAYM